MARYRTGFISDVHLGTRGCDARALLQFLKDNEFETLYLVGDIVDVWALRRSIYWPQEHNDVIQKLLRKGRAGTRLIDLFRRMFGWPHWSLSAYVKREVKNVVNFIGNFEREVARYARHSGVDGVLCGHIHTAGHRTIDGFDYYNTGDWVESRTAIVEHPNGKLEVVRHPHVAPAPTPVNRGPGMSQIRDIGAIGPSPRRDKPTTCLST